MANDCHFEMKIKGTMANCQKWYKKMTSYEVPNHFYRMFSVEIFDEGNDANGYYMCISGDCAWSLETCCRTSGYSNGKDLFAINSSELDIAMEAYSSEPGMAFQEHYIYDHGKCLEEECIDYAEFYYDEKWYDDFVTFKKRCDIPDEVTEDDLDEGWYCKGGYASWDFTI